MCQTWQHEFLRILTQHLDILKTACGKALARDIEERLAEIDEINLRDLIEREILGHLLNVPSCATDSTLSAFQLSGKVGFGRIFRLRRTSTSANVNPNKRLPRVGALHITKLSGNKSGNQRNREYA